MRRFKKVIAVHQDVLRRHHLFAELESTGSVEPIARMARALAWWPMVFQDVLRLNHEGVRGSDFERFAEYHRAEDRGHDRWYLDDLRAFGVDAPGLDDLFSVSFEPVRDACYALIAEVFREQSGAQRVGLLLALESTGHVFFDQIAAAVARVCPELALSYFSGSHLAVERAHDLFTETTEADVDRIVLTEAERSGSEDVVARIYRIFADVFDYLADRMQEGSARSSYVRGLAVRHPLTGSGS